MNRQQLEELFTENKIPSDLYSLYGGLPSEAYCIENENEKWNVYYSERGKKTSIRRFQSEEDACKCLIMEMKKIINIPLG